MKTARGDSRLRGVYAIVNEGVPNPVDLVQAILAGGVRIIQYRAKAGIVAKNARALRTLTKERDALFIINDDWQAALEFNADGAHLGPDDSPATQLPLVRARTGGKILGLSCGTLEEAKRAEDLAVDYIGAGSVFATGSKADGGEAIGLLQLTQIVRSVKLPVCAIGGINDANIADVRATGAAMVAMISAFSQARDPAAMATRLVRLWSGC